MQFGYGVGGSATAIESTRRRWLILLLAFLLGAALVLVTTSTAPPVHAGQNVCPDEGPDGGKLDGGGGEVYDPGWVVCVKAGPSVENVIADGTSTLQQLLAAQHGVTKAVSHHTVVEIPQVPPPTADAGGPYSGNEGAPIGINGTVSANATSHVWTVDDSGCSIAAPSLLVTTVTCDDNGGFTLTLTASHATGSGSDTAALNVENVEPTITSISPAAVAETGETVNVSASFTDPGSADTHSCTFDWGDTNSDVVPDPAPNPCDSDHSYADPGLYTVTVTVEDDDEGTDSDTTTVEVFDVVCAQGALCEIPFAGTVDGNINCIIGFCTTNVEEQNGAEVQILVDGGQYVIVITVRNGPAPGQGGVDVDKDLDGTFETSLPPCGQNGPPNCVHINRLKGNITEYMVFFTASEDPRFKFR